MFVGKWNKSVITTYVGMAFSIISMYMAIKELPLYAFSCFIISGLCDLVDGTIARRCKRTEEEKKFGIQLDSLVDVFSFIALPIVLFIFLGLNKWYYLPIYILYAICGVARLGYFNIKAEEKKDKNKAVEYYIGLPVTYSALILPLSYLISYYLIPIAYTNAYFSVILFAISILYIIRINVKKPSLKTYPLFFLLAIFLLVMFLVVI